VSISLIFGLKNSLLLMGTRGFLGFLGKESFVVLVLLVLLEGCELVLSAAF
jgi:hypothetical protein